MPVVLQSIGLQRARVNDLTTHKYTHTYTHTHIHTQWGWGLLNKNPLISFKGFVSSEMYTSIHIHISTLMHEWPSNVIPATATVANPN